MKKFLSLFSIAILVIACGTKKETTSTTTSPSTPTTSSSSKMPTDVTEYGNTITAADLKEMLYTYASDDFEGRETGQPGQKKAVNYIKTKYQKMGIPSPIKDGSYFQPVPLEILGVPTVSFSVNNKSFTAIDDFVSVTSVSSGQLNADEIVYAGYGIADDAYNSYKDLDVKGKLVLIKSGEPKTADGNYAISGSEETSKWSNMRQQFSDKRDAAKANGAAGILFYYPEVYAMAAGRFGKPSGRMALKGNGESMYYFMINTSVATAIVPDIDTNDVAKAVKMPVSLDYKNDSQEFNSENVLAYIKGSEKPDEVIVISAHLDHEGIKDGKVYNGADDDGSGTVAILEIAEAFRTAVRNGQTPKRSVLFLHVTAEEKGLLGSQYYTDVDPIIPLENTVANLNIDMIGRTDPKHDELNVRNYVYLIGSDKLSTELHEVSEAVNTKYMNIDLDYTYNDDNDPNRFYYRSDHYNFAKNNIPVIFYFNGTHEDYHQPGDTPDKIQYDLLENRTRLVFYTAWELANRDKRVVVDKAAE